MESGQSAQRPQTHDYENRSCELLERFDFSTKVKIALDDAAATRGDSRTLQRNLFAIACLAIGSDRIDGATLLEARHGKDRLDIGAEGSLQGLCGHQRVIAVLIVRQRLAIDEQGLRIGALHFDRRLHQAFNRVGDIVALVQHVRRVEALGLVDLGIHQLIEHQEQPVGIDGTGIKIVIAIFGIVEVEAAQLAELDEARDDHLDIDVRRMVPEIDKTIGLVAPVPGR